MQCVKQDEPQVKKCHHKKVGERGEKVETKAKVSMQTGAKGTTLMKKNA